ncbi:MAG: HAMP domain-containing histidine kinase [Oscillospiraceae bacterium]|nr:HAMP domain-containing histidine kinase [Oscillospiraceae bacterium]
MKLRESISFRILILCGVAAFLSVYIMSSVILNRIETATHLAKQTELQAAASEYATSLSVYGLDAEITLPDTYAGINRRLIITDNSLRIVFDSSDIENHEGKIIYLPAVVTALRGDEFFEFSSSNLRLESSAAAPVVSDGKIIGAVCIFETDVSLQNIYRALLPALLISGIVTILLFLTLGAAFVFFLLRRISNLIKTVKETQGDEKIEKIPVNYNDEVAPIIREFNNIYERLDYVQQMRQAFVSDASHELRTPLAAIRLLCESITQTDDVDTETIREFMEDIILEVDRMSHTAEKLLVLSRLDNGNRKGHAPVSLSETVRKMINAFEPIAADKDVTIESYIEDDCIIPGETEGANQIVGNLIDNAIKYNNVGGTLRIYLFSKNGSCTFITDDTGIGIAPEYREQVFERFYRVDKSREHDGRGGSGLGLAIVKRNVEHFGGTIRISDSVTGGTRFTVVLPSLQTEEEHSI